MGVAVVKLGVGNTASVMFALERLGAEAVLTDDPTRIAEAERVVLPGVGAAAAAMGKLDNGGLGQALRAFPRPMLGICLGQQLLYEFSHEGNVAGLGLLPGIVTELESSTQLPSPHMGWSALAIERDNALIEGVANGAYAYFVHSYVCPVDEAAVATATYGTRAFAAAVARDHFFGCQFHPERSGAVGARVLANFLALPC